MKKIVILASGNGTNFEAICKYFSKSEKISIIKLITDNKEAQVVERAKILGIDYEIIDYSTFKSKKEFNDYLFDRLKALDFDLMVLAGYMRILPVYIVRYYVDKIINIHPSLLPKYPGLRSIERAYNKKEEYTGITIHYVEEEVDGGRIILQKKLKVDKNWDLAKLQEEIHKLEHQYYPQVIENLLSNSDEDS
ncbi:phosphoribosylglycinamide formyltransferase [Petrotoga sp. 9T1HF07.CasAA.8.2]|uniref:phosphoribosylglycinamide formyltransferase n=1 Tax=Petrotoga sp. 9T1HF07.CasAA.8.2 TaxID=1434329 RepID=UPI00074A1E8C|nr:phosphoribosylglycinamide formyltransferase [Petrotoga sp. 9T1HF07.CasAA.8.2]KUK15492.1 MAG: Phosphoribosylglycinamide formyltransferase [Petrotoga mobilis]PNR89892.1 phosphoribosylglycinamide formyltransferase [Petrotoga sp. 9T1HF07.CasAA.8.2]HBT50873.1 phosphoribosylglycinamide formyltransferase [Petrotoga sp.]